MFRIITSILEIAFWLLFGSRYHRSEYIAEASQKLEVAMRRRRALKRSKNFVRKEERAYKLENRFVIVAFNEKEEILRAYNKKNFKDTIEINLSLIDYTIFTVGDSPINQKFDEICMYFDSKTSYFKIANDLKMHFKVKETKAKIEEKKYEVDLGATNDNLLDINTASEKDITALPGVSIILAKKIIKYRNEKGGFESLDEFYKEMKIKPHFIEQLNNQICTKEFKKKKQQKTQNERIIDF